MNKNEVYAYYRETLAGIKEAGVQKNERIITTPQSAHIFADGKELINMCANNYLGLADNPELIQAAKDAYDKYGYGLASVRFICGTQDIHKELERRWLNSLKQKTPFFIPPASMPTAACLKHSSPQRMPSFPTN